MRIVLTGGGTGGHVIPNLAVIEGLKKAKDIELLYIGSKKGMEKKMVEKAGINYKGVSSGKLRRYFSFKNFSDAFKVPLGFFQARKILKKFGADVLFSKGGFVTVPVVIAARTLKIPIILHESDINPGLANRISAKYTSKICVSYEESEKFFNKYSKKIVYTGNPIRESIMSGDKDRAYKFTGLDRHRPVLLIMGGSQGAKQINDLVRASLPELLKKFHKACNDNDVCLIAKLLPHAYGDVELDGGSTKFIISDVRVSLLRKITALEKEIKEEATK